MGQELRSKSSASTRTTRSGSAGRPWRPPTPRRTEGGRRGTTGAGSRYREHPSTTDRPQKPILKNHVRGTMAVFRPKKRDSPWSRCSVTLTILAILAAAVMPIAKTAVKREKEIELRRNLREIREAIDAYKKLADEKKIEVEEDRKAIRRTWRRWSKASRSRRTRRAEKRAGKRPKKIVKFLRRIPRDPMTGFHGLGASVLPGRTGFGRLGRRECL